MNIHLNKEYGPNKDNSRRLKNKIIDQGHNLDHVLFTRIILLARAELLV
jgi:hypothetical protein